MRSNHNVSYPVVKVDGLSFNVRRQGGGTFGDMAAAYIREVSLLQNNAISKVGNHAIVDRDSAELAPTTA